MFIARFFYPTDTGFYDDSDVSTWSWDEQPIYKEQIVDGLRYWAEVLQPPGNGSPTLFNIGTIDQENNAFGGSALAQEGNSPRTEVQENIMGLSNDAGSLPLRGHGGFGLGKGDYTPNAIFTQTPLSGKDDVLNTTIHEIGHAFGLLNSVTDTGNKDPRFTPVLNTMARLLVDDNGNPARPGQTILCAGCTNPYDPNAFDARQDNARLVGPNIRAVLDGGLPGVPVKMLSVSGAVDTDYMSHTELRNSMMSHQYYRNYTGFMEAELAVLQDMGYTIDRANFFGRSIYGDGLNIVNTRGFFARNAEGTAYLPGQYNKATLGLGLHIYGSNNQVRQAADLLAAGSGGAGIRVDGENNTVVIDPGVRVHANGTNGQGIQFAYGRNHTLVQRGNLEALGQNGVGLRFDFGSNALGPAVENRGSYIRNDQSGTLPMLDELNGPLVSQADISGRIAGKQAAILISENAYVERINFLRGVQLQGNITSSYNQTDGTGNQRLTTLSFGQATDSQGRATGRPDASFNLSYAGDIQGENNLTLSFDGGTTRLNGKVRVHGATVQQEGTLGGNPEIILTTGTKLVNRGTVAPGNSIGRMTIDGDYVQETTGTLSTEFDATGAHDILDVSGNVTLQGTLELVPMADWYSGNWSINTGNIVQSGGTLTNTLNNVTLAGVSPTLQFSFSNAPGSLSYSLSATRPANAYSRYAADSNGLSAGNALFRLSSAGATQTQALFKALDFSAKDGSDITRALAQISPAGYSTAIAASLLRERMLMQTAQSAFGRSLAGTDNEWSTYAVATGGLSDQHSRGSLIGYDAQTYGLILGGGRSLPASSDLALGGHLDISHQSVAPDSPYRGQGQATSVGIGAQLQFRAHASEGLHAYTGVRTGLELASMKRQIRAGSYSADHKANWTSYSTAFDAGLGYRWLSQGGLSWGPAASISYARLYRPSLSESGNDATRLLIDGLHVDAMRSGLGLAAAWNATSNGNKISLQAAATWQHEFLDREVHQRARFSVAPDIAFDTINEVLPRNTLDLQASLNWRQSEGMLVGIDLGGQFGSGYRALNAQLNATWVF